jgi:hypothetical protein
MEYVAMVAFVVTLTFVTILLVCGIVVNMYLYTHGLFRARRMGRSRAFEDRDEDYFSNYLSGRYDFTGDYIRKALLLIVIGIVIACFVIITLVVPLFH